MSKTETTEKKYNRRFYDQVIENDVEKVVGSQKFEELFKTMMDLVFAYQNLKGPSLPKEIFLKFIETAREYCCTEILVKDEKGNLLLKRRNDPTAVKGELEWEGDLHIPGTKSNHGFRSLDETLKYLVDGEILKDDLDNRSEKIERIVKSAKAIGFLVYPEPERKTTAPTIMYEVVVDGALLQDGFEVVDDHNQVIEQHRPILEWYKQSNRPFALDTRK